MLYSLAQRREARQSAALDDNDRCGKQQAASRAGYVSEEAATPWCFTDRMTLQKRGAAPRASSCKGAVLYSPCDFAHAVVFYTPV